MRELLHTLFYVNLLLWLENKNHMSGIKWLRVPQTDGAFDGAGGSGGHLHFDREASEDTRRDLSRC